MVQRVFFDDPTLLALDLTGNALPQFAEEPRVLPRLFEGLQKNTRLESLRLAACGIGGTAVSEAIAEALAKNKTLRVLDLELNFLEPAHLERVFGGLAKNQGLEVLLCSDQCQESDPFGLQRLESSGAQVRAAGALAENHTLLKLGLALTEPHWADQIRRSLLRNLDARRRKRRAEHRLAVMRDGRSVGGG